VILPGLSRIQENNRYCVFLPNNLGRAIYMSHRKEGGRAETEDGRFPVTRSQGVALRRPMARL